MLNLSYLSYDIIIDPIANSGLQQEFSNVKLSAWQAFIKDKRQLAIKVLSSGESKFVRMHAIGEGNILL